MEETSAVKISLGVQEEVELKRKMRMELKMEVKIKLKRELRRRVKMLLEMLTTTTATKMDVERMTKIKVTCRKVRKISFNITYQTI